MDWLPALSSAFLLGLMSSGHCLGMCGGIACALGLQADKSTFTLLIYHAGRIASYALLALLFGATLQHLTHQQPLLSPILRSIAGLLLLAMALHIANIWSGITQLERLGTRWWQPLQKLAKPLLPANTNLKVFALGLLWGWLPCALVYSTLAWSASRANAVESTALMIFFGLGTAPALLASGIFSQQLKAFFQKTSWRYAAACLLGMYALWTLSSAWMHLGHH
ncbi:MAG: sulfite exporter TauE/SafE family protein [Pseudomonadales bacterium]